MLQKTSGKGREDRQQIRNGESFGRVETTQKKMKAKQREGGGNGRQFSAVIVWTPVWNVFPQRLVIHIC